MAPVILFDLDGTLVDSAVDLLNALNVIVQETGKPALSLEEMRQQGVVQYIPFPEALKGKYQSYTQADMKSLRGKGYAEDFLTVEEGVARYVNRLHQR